MACLSIRCIALALCTLIAMPADADLLDTFKKWIPIPGSSPPAPEVSESVANAPVVQPPKDYQSEMAADRNCSRPRDKFNVADKIADYGGTAATLRLQRLITTDFQYSDLKPEDKQMLQYIAQTSVWVPPEVEDKLAAVYDKSKGFFKREAPLNELEELAFDDVRKRLERVRETVPEYPSEIRLKVDHELKDGAFARFGGLIQISDRFLNGLGDAGAGADFLLSHEVSHVYKRHSIKGIQFTLISSSEGWNLAKQVLRGVPGIGNQGSDMFREVKDIVTGLGAIPALMEYVSSVQINFTKDQELEADACSVEWLRALKVEPKKAWADYQDILGANSTYDALHPSTAQRKASFDNRVDQKAVAPVLSADKGTVKKEGAKIIANPAGPRASGSK